MKPSDLGKLAAAGGGGTCEPTAAKKVERDFMAGNEADIELGLGLSLGGGAAARGKGCGWAEHGRILTAKDFPNGFPSGRGGAVGAGTKRERSAGVDEECTFASVSQVVGWPPIRTFRMNNTLCNQSKASNDNEEKRVGGNENNKNSKKKVNHGTNGDNNESGINEIVRPRLGYVKVNMDGLPIGRKVNLNAHKSYESLAKILVEMFLTPSLTIRGGKEREMEPLKLLDGSSEFVLTYEDKEGDWMLVGDVPFRMFLSTVKRLRIMRTSEANGLPPKSQERDEERKGKPI